MDGINDILRIISGYVWGAPLLILLMGAGIYLTLRLKLLQVRRLLRGFRFAFGKAGGSQDDEGDISHFQALMTALAATIGTGNIVGVSTAVMSGGPGALLWMWLSAFFGMATKYAEAILAVRYREKNPRGEMAGGPMYYIKNGMHNRWLAMLFALFGTVAALGIGNMVQANSIAMSIKTTFGMTEAYSGLLMLVFTALVILGGIKSIGKAAGFLVPTMATAYILGGVAILLLNMDQVPAALQLVWQDAFTGKAMAGGAVGSVIRYGVARGVFSNEAGLGSAPIAAAAARTDMPGRQAIVSMLGTFIDTIMVCSITGLVVVMSGSWQDGALNGVNLTSVAFEHFLPGFGKGIVNMGLILFAYSTILGWCYYGEKCFEYMAGYKIIKAYRIIYIAVVYIGATSSLETVWNFADVFNGLMAVPNLIALIVLSPVVVEETKAFERKLEQEEDN